MDKPKMSATKAHVSGAATSVALLFLFFVGPYIGLPIPEVQTVTEALLHVVESLVGGAIAWYATWRTPNRPLSSHWLAGALLLMLFLPGCTATQAVTEFTDSQVYPAARVAMCSLSQPLVEARTIERYEATGVVLLADCDWRPGKTWEEFMAETQPPLSVQSDPEKFSPPSN